MLSGERKKSALNCARHARKCSKFEHTARGQQVGRRRNEELVVLAH